MALFPPWVEVIPALHLGSAIKPEMIESLGYAPIFSPPPHPTFVVSEYDRKAETQENFNGLFTGVELYGPGTDDEIRERIKEKNRVVDAKAKTHAFASVKIDIPRLSVQIVAVLLVFGIAAYALRRTQTTGAPEPHRTS